jgi:RNA polymerase sigma-70 factor, ECF subfamily
MVCRPGLALAFSRVVRAPAKSFQGEGTSPRRPCQQITVPTGSPSQPVHCACRIRQLYSVRKNPEEGRVEFFDFDETYFRRLQGRDPLTEDHFVAYFSDLLQIKLRSRLNSPQAIEDVKQETFVRVLTALRSETGIRSPERLGAFVNSVCNNVLLEHYRSSSRTEQQGESLPDPPDKTIDLDGFLVTKQTCQQVRQVLEQLPHKDRRLLRALFLEEKEKDEVCSEFKVDRNYLRVLLHRAKQSFRTLYEKRETRAVERAVTEGC